MPEASPDAPLPDSQADGDTALEVVFVEPADGVSSVDPNSSVTVMFSKAVAPESVDAATFVISVDNEPVAGALSVAGASVTFTPEQSLARATLHVARIAKTVTDLQGKTLGKEHSWSFVTRDRQWQDAERLELAIGGADKPQVAMDGSGNAMAVWSQHDGKWFSIWGSRFDRDSGSWNDPQLVETNDQGDANAPQVAMDASGNAVVVYWQHDGVRYNIWAGRYVASSNTWGTPQLVETNDDGDASDPQVAVNASGNAVVVYWQFDGTRYNIWANQFTASNGTWATAELVEDNNVGDASDPQVTLNDSGEAAVVYWQFDGARYNIWANRRASNGTWGTAEPIETDDQGDASDPRVVIDNAGNVTAIWSQSDGARYSIWANRYDAAVGAWATSQLVENNDQGDAQVPYLSADNLGNIVAVWNQSDGARYSVWTSAYATSTSSWATPELIETNDQGDTFSPHVAMNRDGNAIVVWAQSDGALSNAWANRYVEGNGAWATAAMIEANNLGSVGAVRVAVDPGGNGVAVWAQHDGTGLDIWAGRFE